MRKTSRYKNSKALRAWLLVEAETCRSVASMVKKASTSAAPMSRGCRTCPPVVCQRMKTDPVKVSFLRARAIVQIADALAKLIHQADRAGRGSAGFHCLCKAVYLYSLNIGNQACESSSGGIHARFLSQRPEYSANFAAQITLGVTVNPISDLAALLKSLQPELNSGTYSFASLPSGHTVGIADVVAVIQEPEGTSVVVNSADLSRLGLRSDFLCAWITLTVNSDLEAVGLTAAFSSALGSAGISCNVVAGTNHDHIFVPVSQAAAAMKVLQGLQERAIAEGVR